MSSTPVPTTHTSRGAPASPAGANPARRRAGWRRRRGLGRKLVSAFILWHLAAVTLWLLPFSALVAQFEPAVRPYMTLTGFMQSWAMFSPNPAHAEVSVEARVTRADGRVTSWEYPRMSRLGYAERYRSERYRKLIEFANLDENAALWPSLAGYAARRSAAGPAARRSAAGPAARPVAVALVRHTRTVSPPGWPAVPDRAVTFYSAPVRPEDLR